MFTLQIQCANIDEAWRILASVKRGTTVEMLKPDAVYIPAPAQEPKKRARRREGASPQLSLVPGRARTLTEASIRDALKSVQAKYGEADMSKPLDILGKFHAGRISEVQPADYPAFIAACEAA